MRISGKQEIPTVAVTLGDPAGIGAELVAKLLQREDVMQHANVVLIGDPWLWQEGQRIAGTSLNLPEISDMSELNPDQPAKYFLPVHTLNPEQVQPATANAAGGQSTLHILSRCLDMVSAREIDAICFAPLNKHAMKLAGMRFDDELHFFADYLKVKSYFCEFNTLGSLWTSRISSHIPLKEVVNHLSVERIQDAARLLYKALQASGVARPKVAVAALNPHGGDGGTCGREEIDIIIPAVRRLQEEGYPIDGPFPADTIFLKARAGQYDGIVTMYHDQGQIAIKLMGFEKGVTVQGGLPVPITTPAHGTAYDIAGKNSANPEAMIQAFLIACRMGAAFRAGQFGAVIQ